MTNSVRSRLVKSKCLHLLTEQAYRRKEKFLTEKKSLLIMQVNAIPPVHTTIATVSNTNSQSSICRQVKRIVRMELICYMKKCLCTS